MTPLRFVVEGSPVGKMRPRSDRRSGRVYTPTPTIKFERAVREAGALALASWIATSGEPWSLVGEFLLVTRGFADTARAIDGDNVQKSVADALNGLLWTDDRSVGGAYPPVRVDRRKPRTEVEVVRVLDLTARPRLEARDVEATLDAARQLVKAWTIGAPLDVPLALLEGVVQGWIR